MKSVMRLGLVSACLLTVAACDWFKKKEEPKVDTKTIISFLGAPGAGKGTLAEQAVNKLGFIVLSTGNVCRELVASGSEQGKAIESCMKEGKLIPDEMVTEMVATWLEKHVVEDKPIILDGYPRSARQAEMLVDLLQAKFPEHHFRVMALDVSEDEIVKRLASRLVCTQCKAVTNVSLLKNAEERFCPTCKGALTQREDDKEEVVRARLNVYAEQTKPLVDFYMSKGIAIEPIDAHGSDVEKLFENFKAVLFAAPAQQQPAPAQESKQAQEVPAPAAA